MAKATDVVGKCQRCYGGQVPAVKRVRFNFDGVPYETLLCHNHAERIASDMQSWIRTATELGVTRADEATVTAFPPIGRPSTGQGTDRRPVRVPRPARIVTGNVSPALTLRAGRPADQDPLFAPPDEIRPDIIERWQDAFTDHALERMELRRISVTQVLRCIQATGKTRRCPSKPGASLDTAMYEFEDVRVVVNERTTSIMTVARPSDDLFTEAAI